MINIADNFNLAGSTKPLDGRDEFNTLAAMKACIVCNELHICYNKETKKQYQFNSSNSLDPTTGYWREYTVGSGSGDVTGATIGSGASAQNVTKLGGVLQFPAYPTVPINKIKVDGESNDLPINDGRVVIPQPPVKGIKTNSGSDLTPNNGIVTLPPIPADQSIRIKNIEESIAKIGNNQPTVIPSSAVELPVSTSNPDYIDYDSDTTYVMNIDGTQVATIHYPYIDNNNNYVAFKAIDRDLYYAYSVSVVNDTERYTYSNQYTWSTLPADAKSKFESGIYAIKQVINDDGTLPEKKWYKNIPSVFVDKNNLPLRTRRINETISSSTIDVLLVKNDRLNKIYRYAFNANSNVWVLINGGCYTKDDSTTGANYELYDKYFDRKDASDVDFDNTSIGLSGTTVQAAIEEVVNKLGYAVNPQATINNNPTKNEYYDFTNSAISSLDIHNVSISNTNEIVILFLTDTNGCSITMSTSQRILGSTSLANNAVYILSILRGIVCIVEAPSYIQSVSLSSTPESE